MNAQGPIALRGRRIQPLSRMIFQAEVPEAAIRALPAQTLYMVLKHNGLHSSGDLIETATIEQCRLLLDLDLWHRDEFNEDNLWEWLALPDATNDLGTLQKLLKAVDLKLISILISKYVHAQIFDEPTENPPSAEYYTPDKGYTWLSIVIEDEAKHFLLARLLALIFETSAALFYQLMSISGVATLTMLEEESFQEKTSRLSSEGIPQSDYAASINSPISPGEVLALLRQNSSGRAKIMDIHIIEPLVYEGLGLEPLTSLINSIQAGEVFEAELTLISNAGLVHYQIDFSEQSLVLDLIAKIKGALNIGLEVLLRDSGFEMGAIYESLGLQPIYRAGLSKLFELRAAVKKKSAAAVDPQAQALVEALTQPFPCIPVFVRDDGTVDAPDGKLAPGTKPIEKLSTVESIMKTLSD